MRSTVVLISRQLPNETRLFTQVDRSWKDIMRRAADRPNALKAATSPGKVCFIHVEYLSSFVLLNFTWRLFDCNFCQL